MRLIKMTFFIIVLMLCCQTPADAFYRVVPNAADPFVYKDNRDSDKGKYYLYTTNADGNNVPVYGSTDLKEWTPLGNAMPSLAKWAKPGFNWAPEVINIKGQYLLYYTAREKSSNLQCVSVAISDSAEGPFIDNRTTPLICQRNQGGSIDPNPYRDEDGRLYLLWKNAGLRFKMKTYIWITPLSDDGLSVSGKSETLISNDKAWEGPSVEAPTLIRRNGQYYLFYSGDVFNTARYAVGFAKSDKLLGPYVKSKNNPILRTKGELLAPGHQSIFRDSANAYWIVFHSYDGHVARGRRNTHIYKIEWINDEPRVLINVEP